MLKKLILSLLAILVLVAAGGFTYLFLRKPAMRQSPRLTVDRAPERIARGKYLFSMCACADCHSEVSTNKFLEL